MMMTPRPDFTLRENHYVLVNFRCVLVYSPNCSSFSFCLLQRTAHAKGLEGSRRNCNSRKRNLVSRHTKADCQRGGTRKTLTNCNRLGRKLCHHITAVWLSLMRCPKDQQHPQTHPKAWRVVAPPPGDPVADPCSFDAAAFAGLALGGGAMGTSSSSASSGCGSVSGVGAGGLAAGDRLGR